MVSVTQTLSVDRIYGWSLQFAGGSEDEIEIIKIRRSSRKGNFELVRRRMVLVIVVI